MRLSRIALILMVAPVLLGLVPDSSLAPEKPGTTVHRSTPKKVPQFIEIEGPIDGGAAGSGSGNLTSSGSTLGGAMSKDCPDTFLLYGGPGEGTFQAPDNVAPDRQGWTGLDFTDYANPWQLSTFNAANLGAHGPGNVAAWAGRTAAQEPTWATPPGYGNGWFEELRWSSGPLQDPSQGQVVTLDFVFNYEVEQNYDYVRVEYQSAAAWNEVLALTGTNKVSGIFEVPGVRFSDVATGTIEYLGNDYGGQYGDEIVLRIVVETDGGWSDEDGLNPTDGGAMQVDDITVEWSDQGQTHMSFEDFEDWVSDEWQGPTYPFVGDFTKVFALAEDIDPCRENDSPVMTWIDDGTPPANDPLQRSTGGSLSPTWSYGVRGGWVVNYNGGLSYGLRSLRNAAVSPPIALDLAGTCDDGDDVSAIWVHYDKYQHAPWVNGFHLDFYYRFSNDGGTSWGPWNTDGRWYGGSLAKWKTWKEELEVPPGTAPTHTQLAFLLMDLCSAKGCPGNDATPAPYLDNVRLYKARIQGPTIAFEEPYMAQDGFPPNGSIAAATQAERDALDIPFFWNATATVPDPPWIPFTATAKIAGTTVTDARMVWVLEKNPVFEDAIRSVPNRPEDENVDATDPLRWSGEVKAGRDEIDGSYFVSLPPTDFLYPGDVLRYHFQAADSDGRVTTLPHDVSGFDDGAGYDRQFVVRGLPSIRDAAGDQPKILFVIQGMADDRFFSYFGQLGYELGTDYDLYLMQGHFLANHLIGGIGSAGGHGATANQLGGYECIVFEVWRWIGVGDDITSDDIGLLTAWHDLPGARSVVYFGDYIAQRFYEDLNGLTYLTNVLNIGYVEPDAYHYVDQQRNPVVQPTSPFFAASYGVRAGCPAITGIDVITPIGAATVGHHFVDRQGVVVPDIAASVIHDRVVGDDRKVDIFFPYKMAMVQSQTEGTGPLSPASALLEDVFAYIGTPPPSGAPTSAPTPVALLSGLRSYPNPFNPSITIEFSLGREAHVELGIFNLRGQLVKTLIDEELTPGQQRWRWNGEDSHGVSVASGVYVYRVRVGEIEELNKIALIR